MPTVPASNPGFYAGGAKANLLRANQQQYLFQQQLNTGGAAASIAGQLERIKSGFFYPFGASFQIWFSDVNGNPSNPGAFLVNIEDSDIDQDNQYSVIQ